MKRRPLRILCSPLCLLLWLAMAPRPARAWELFRSESSAVERGNEHLEKGQAKEALEAYDEAARELPNDPAVQLDRGLALKALNKLGEAREAFRRAGAAGAPKDVRGPALYDLGLTFMQEADQAGQAEDLDGAKKLLEESVDAFRGSLRAQPQNRDAAWNLELAKRRLVDTQKKQEEKKKQEEEKKKQDEQNKDDQNKDDQNKDDQNKDDQNKDDQNKDDQNKDDQNKDDQNKEPQPDAGAPEPGDGGSPNQNDGQGEPDAGAPPQPEPKPEPGGDAGAPEPEPEAEQPSEPSKQDPNALPEHMQRALDALESSEENLEKLRARQRARSRPRRIDKDW